MISLISLVQFNLIALHYLTKGPFVNLGIGTSALELELELIQQTPLFPVRQVLWTTNLAGW